MIRLLAVAGILVAAVAVAVMPLGGLFSGGVFETWVGGNEYRPRVRVIVHDQTGLVRAAIGLGEGANRARSRVALSVPISGSCGTRTVHLEFRDTGSEYLVQQTNDDFGCPHDFSLWGFGSVAIVLWSPVDDPVRFESRYDERLL